jgi:hypothetical protein
LGCHRSGDTPHNYRHHVFTNALEIDDDLGFGVMRLSCDQPWRPRYLVQPLRNLLLAITFEWSIALHGIHAAQNRAQTRGEKSAQWHGRQEDRPSDGQGLPSFSGAEPHAVAPDHGRERG